MGEHEERLLNRKPLGVRTGYHITIRFWKTPCSLDKEVVLLSGLQHVQIFTTTPRKLVCNISQHPAETTSNCTPKLIYEENIVNLGDKLNGKLILVSSYFSLWANEVQQPWITSQEVWISGDFWEDILFPKALVWFNVWSFPSCCILSGINDTIRKARILFQEISNTLVMDGILKWDERLNTRDLD